MNLLCAGNNIFVKYQAQGGVNPNPPLRTPLFVLTKNQNETLTIKTNSHKSTQTYSNKPLVL